MMRSNNGRKLVEMNASSMADIAFLLLIFFLVTTTFEHDKGILMRLPPDVEIPPQPVNNRNLFKILINSKDELMVENQYPYDFDKLKHDIHQFVMNNGLDEKSSESPVKAVVSIKTNRGTSYKRYIEILDVAQGVYYEIYGKKVGLTADEFRHLDLKNPQNQALYQRAKDGIPMNISIASPSN